MNGEEQTLALSIWKSLPPRVYELFENLKADKLPSNAPLAIAYEVDANDVDEPWTLSPPISPARLAHSSMHPDAPQTAPAPSELPVFPLGSHIHDRTRSRSDPTWSQRMNLN